MGAHLDPGQAHQQPGGGDQGADQVEGLAHQGRRGQGLHPDFGEASDLKSRVVSATKRRTSTNCDCALRVRRIGAHLICVKYISV